MKSSLMKSYSPPYKSVDSSLPPSAWLCVRPLPALLPTLIMLSSSFLHLKRPIGLYYCLVCLFSFHLRVAQKRDLDDFVPDEDLRSDSLPSPCVADTGLVQGIQ